MISLIENSVTEFKASVNKKHDKLEQEVVAFLNTKGGHIYFGVDDDGNVIGVNDPDKDQLTIRERLLSSLAPSIQGRFEILTETIEDKQVIHVIVAAGNEKPYYIKQYGMTPEGAYERIGSSITKLSEKRIFELFSRRTRNSIVNIISPRQDLTFEQLEIYYKNKGYIFSKNTFSQLRFYLDDQVYNYLAYLLSDQNALSINVGLFNGKTVVDLKGMKTYSDQSLIKTTKEILDYIDNQNRTFTKITALDREEKFLFDKVAMREAVINALVHNDYTYENVPIFRIYEDRIEIISSGGPSEDINEEEFLGGYSNPKNPELMKVFKDLGIAEHLGTGILRILNVYDKSIYQFTKNFIKVTIPLNANNRNDIKQEHVKDKPMYYLTDRQAKIIELIENNQRLTQDEIGDTLGVSRFTIIREIKELQENGLIERIGSNKTGCWQKK